MTRGDSIRSGGFGLLIHRYLQARPAAKSSPADEFLVYPPTARGARFGGASASTGIEEEGLPRS